MTYWEGFRKVLELVLLKIEPAGCSMIVGTRGMRASGILGLPSFWDGNGDGEEELNSPPTSAQSTSSEFSTIVPSPIFKTVEVSSSMEINTKSSSSTSILSAMTSRVVSRDSVGLLWMGSDCSATSCVRTSWVYEEKRKRTRRLTLV